MPVDTQILQAGGQLAVGLAGLVIPGAGPAVSGLSALMAAINEYNRDNGKPADYVPSREELQAFIADRRAQQIATPGHREDTNPPGAL